MIQKGIFILILLLTPYHAAYPCNICGGGTNDLIVLSLDGKMLFNFNISYDNYLGVWDGTGVWHPTAYSQTQVKTSFGFAYRINSHMQFSISLPYVFNRHPVPGLRATGNGIGDISVNGRYEFFHEYQLNKSGGKPRIDNVKPYLALTFGLTVPTGMSTEYAISDIDVTGKGFYTASLGISLIKSIIKNRLKLSTDFSWQHTFEKTFDKEYGVSTTPYKKQLGDKFFYSAAINYIFSSEHAMALSVTGYSQSMYSINSTNWDNSQERNLSLAASYTYYPALQFRITPAVKWVFTGDNLGRNATGSTTYTLSLSYYIPEKLN